MPEIIFQTLKSTATGVNASTGKQTEVAFNDNFSLAKNLFEQLFNVAAVTITSDEITQIKADTTTTPYTLYYTTDDPTSNNITWIPLVITSFAKLEGSPTDNIALRTALDSKGSASDVSTLQTQMTAAQDNISNLQTTVAGHTTTIGAHTVAINNIQSDLADRVRTPHGDTLYLRYVSSTNTIEYSTDGTTYIDINSLGTSFADLTGNASDNTSLVNYVTSQIQNALSTIATDYASMTAFNNHVNNTSNPHSVTKAQLGLGDVENYSTHTMPIPDSVQAALNNITSNTPPIYSETPAAYRAGTPEVGSVYFTSNDFAI